MFTSDEYEHQRQAVIDIFNRYVKNRNELLRSVDMSDNISKDVLELLAKRVQNVDDNKYLLVIVGESKSGKSMFINALLEKPILPTGILQCTSGIIEILDTNNPHDNGKVYLKVRYANQSETQLEYKHPSNDDITSIQERLREIAALQERYRALPIFQLNQYLKCKRNQQITREDIEELLKTIENPHKLPDDQFKQRVQEYLADYRDLSRVPDEIKVGYPLGFNFNQMRIVDTPGVNARGGLKDATVRFVKDANAAIFIHMLKSNIASESLNKFFKEALPNDAEENVFLFLTHKAHSTREGIKTILEEAARLFPEIKPGRIIAVDSMLKQVYNELVAGKPLEELIKNEEMLNLIAPYMVKFPNDMAKIQNTILEDSNFGMAQHVLQEFSEKALAAQLGWIVTQIAEGYKEQHRIYVHQIRLRESKLVKTPEEFESEITTLQKLLEDYRTILNDFSAKKSSEYTGLYSEVHAEFSKLKELYMGLLTSAYHEDQIHKHIMDFNSDCEKKTTLRTAKLNKEYAEKMEQVGAEFQSMCGIITTPRLNLEDISNTARTRAYETVKIPGDKVSRAGGGAVAGALLGALYGLAIGGPIGALVGAIAGGVATGASEYLEGTPTRIESRFNDATYKSTYISIANSLVSTTAGQMSSAIGELFKSYDNNFKNKLGEIIKERQKAYEQLKEKKVEAEQLLDEVKQLEFNEKTVTGEFRAIEAVTSHIS